MADTSYAFKTDDETKGKIKKMIDESGVSSKEFFTNLVSMFELQRARTKTPILASDIDELELLTQRINSIFVNVSERIGTLQADHTRDIEDRAASSKDTIHLLQQRIHALEKDRLADEKCIEEFISNKEQAELKVHELSQRAKQLEDVNTKNDTIIQEYKQKIDDLSAIVLEYKTAYEDNKKLRQDNTIRAQEITTLTATIENMKAAHDKAVANHAAELEVAKEHVTDKLSIAHDKAMLKLENDYRLKLDEQQTRHNEKLDKYENKVSQLLQDIESLGNTKTAY